MAHSTKTATQRVGRSAMPPTVTLALWRLRESWELLLVTGAGILAAVVLVCTAPLYAQVVMSAGLRGALGTDPFNTDIIVRGSSTRISAPVLGGLSRQLDHEFQTNLGPYLMTPQFSIETQVLPITDVIPDQSGAGAYHPRDTYQMGLISEPIDQAASHATLIQGRLPQNTTGADNSLEIAITQRSADLLHVHAGSTLITPVLFVDGYLHTRTRPLTLHIVGIFKISSPTDTFWHDEDFQPYKPSDFITVFGGLVPNTSLLSVLTRMSDDLGKNNFVFRYPSTIIWYYTLNTPHLSADDVKPILSGISTVKTDNANNGNLEQSPYLSQTQTYMPSDTLNQYSSRLEAAQLPVICLSLLMAGMVLFFVSIMADILVDQQEGAIAILRSRGASSRQVFGSLVTQSVGLGIIALIAGPLLAIVVTRLLVHGTLPAGEQGALNLISGNPLQVAWGLRIYALVTVAAAISAMIVAIIRTMRLDVLTVRREAARSTHRPLWQRLHLDIVIAIIALTGYGISVYVSSANVLDIHAALLLLSPLTLLGALCLLLAALLFFLRFFPRFLRSGASLTRSSRGASPLLALAQMSRVPRHSLRLILQLSLATAFAFFTLTCIASQSQRVEDIANFQVGADFSGTIPVNIITSSHLQEGIASYAHIPGVLSASVGYVQEASAGTISQTIPIDFRSVDAETFAQTGIWPQSYLGSSSFKALMQQLAAQRTAGIAHQLVPAIVDATTWNSLHLSPGAHFALNFSLVDYNNRIDFVAMAEVPHIPTPNSSVGSTVLADYTTFANVYKQKYGSGSDFAVPANTVWLRTKSDPASLATIRSELGSTQNDLWLNPLYDRRAMVNTLYHEPLYLTLIGVLALGATVALLFALVGNLIASWLSVRSRLVNFTVLRALGAEPRQVVSTLTWEQCIIYVTSIVLGALVGAIFSELVVPALIFTSVTPPAGVTSGITSGEFYVAQSVPPIQVVMPSQLGLALLALIILCIIALVMMAFVVLRSSMSQTLRINDD